MTFTTDCKFLENELLDVVRLFKRRPENLTHSFRFEEGVFYNTFTQLQNLSIAFYHNISDFFTYISDHSAQNVSDSCRNPFCSPCILFKTNA